MPYIGNPIYQSAFVTDTFSGNGSTTAFTMSVAPAGVTNVLVAVSGVLQDPSTYGVVGNTITFSAAPPSGTGNISCRYLGVPVTGVTTTAYRTVTEFTATANQTTFTPPSYTVGFIDVYRNGALLGSADFTATNGTTVVLANAASEGDLIETVSFLVSSVLNAIAATAGSVGTTYLANASVTQAKLGTNVAGNGPAFGYYQSVAQSMTAGVYTKITFTTSEFDTTGGMYASSRFTPTVAGYYQVNASFNIASTFTGGTCVIYKNGSGFKQGSANLNGGNKNSSGWTVSSIIYCNGSTDYLEVYGQVNDTQNTFASQPVTYFNACLIRAA
jgi:hypothetical protein